MPIREDEYIFTDDDLMQIEKTLYEPKKDELTARQLVSVKKDYHGSEKEIGYDWYNRQGSAKIFASGGRTKDIPFVGEEKHRVTKDVFTIVSGVSYDADELDAHQLAKSQAKGPMVNIDTLRVKTAREYISEKEDESFYNGNEDLGFQGLFNHDDINVETVAEGTDGPTATEKRKWTYKTPQEILLDLRKGIKAIEKDGWFKARRLVVSPVDYLELTKPYSEHSLDTVLDWINRKLTFEKIIVTNRCLAKNTTYSTNCFCILDTDPEVVQLAIIKDIWKGEPKVDLLGNQDIAILEKTAGCLLRHPSAVYVGTGIG